jgi:hypothetical protein
MAPEPSDLIWKNAHVNLGWSRGREWTANALLGLGAVLWSVPVAGIQALATADQVATVPGLAWVATLNGGDVANFVNGYLPVVLLLTIIMILPHVFYVVALKYEDRKTQSDVQASIIGRYFYYQLVRGAAAARPPGRHARVRCTFSSLGCFPSSQANIFITVTAGSILESLGEIIEHPGSILAILGKSLPNVGESRVASRRARVPVLPLSHASSFRVAHSGIFCDLHHDEDSRRTAHDTAAFPRPPAHDVHQGVFPGKVPDAGGVSHGRRHT